jgi:hypothetical protein
MYSASLVTENLGSSRSVGSSNFDIISPARMAHRNIPEGHEESTAARTGKFSCNESFGPSAGRSGFVRRLRGVDSLTGTPLSVQPLEVQLFFGSDSEKADIERRALETSAVAKWTALRNSSSYAGAREPSALGAFNSRRPGRTAPTSSTAP